MSWLWLPLLAAAWLSWRYAWWRVPVDSRHPRILMYHMIASPRRGARFNGLRVAPDMFERQLRWLTQHGWKSCFVSELAGPGACIPDKAFAITFDDGYRDNYTAALPLLEKYACKATLYLVVERHGPDWSVKRKPHHDEGELGAEAKLSDADIEAMLASGLIELGSHGLTHANMPQLDDVQAQRELSESRRRLEARFGVPVTAFAWPFGLYRQSQVAQAESAGYQSAVTTHEGIDRWPPPDPLQLRRIKISGRDGFLAFLLRMRTGRRGLR